MENIYFVKEESTYQIIKDIQEHIPLFEKDCIASIQIEIISNSLILVSLPHPS